MSLVSSVQFGAKTPETNVAETERVWRANEAQLVDVREPREWTDGHIPGSIHIPLGDLVGRAGELDKSLPVVAICRSGRRSLTATDALLELGFAQVASMQGGMIAWSNAGLPVE